MGWLIVGTLLIVVAVWGLVVLLRAIWGYFLEE